MYIYYICDAYQKEDKYLVTNSLKSNFIGKRVVCNGTHDISDVVYNNKYQKCIEQSIADSNKVDELLYDFYKPRTGSTTAS